MNLKKHGKVLTSKSVGTGPSSYKKKKIYRAAVSKKLRNTRLNGQVSVNGSNVWCPFFYGKNAPQRQQDRKNVVKCAFLGYNAASGGNLLPTFRDNLSVPFSEVKKQNWDPIGCPETSVTNYHYLLFNNPKERRSHLLCEGRLKSRRKNVTILL